MWLKLCNSPSTAYMLVYHEVWIRAFIFLKTVKELQLLNSFTLDTISISLYPPLRWYGDVFLLTTPEEPTGSLHPTHAATHTVDWPPYDVICNYFLPPPQVLSYQPKPCRLKRHIHTVPLPFPTVAPYRHQMLWWKPSRTAITAYVNT